MTRQQTNRLERLLRELDSIHVEVREAALEQVRALPPDQLVRLAERDIANARRRRVQTYLHTGLVAALPGVSLLLPASVSADCLAALFVATPFALVHTLKQGNRPTHAHRAIGTLLGEMRDPRFIGPAVEMVLESNVQASNATMNSILRALKRMIRRLRADQAELLTKKQKQALLTLLQTPYADFELMLSILKALEQVGDADAIPVVERLAEQSVAKVRRAAEECLIYLHQRVEMNQQAQTLLRAAENQAIPPETLLRPALSLAEDTPPHELLRSLGPGVSVVTLAEQTHEELTSHVQ